jgi:hypothetical protein
MEISGPATGLLDDPLLLRSRGEGLFWRARLRDDDGYVWRTAADRAEQLADGWAPAKPASAGPLAALHSLRPVRIDVRAETADGRSANRTIERRLVADGVRVRRWRDGLAATLHLPADEDPAATVVVDATAGPDELSVATITGPLLASRGVVALVVGPVRGGGDGAGALATAIERLSAVPAAPPEVVTIAPILPPGVPARDGVDGSAARARAWDELLARLGARPRS